MKLAKSILICAGLLMLTGNGEREMDASNPTCPAEPNWTDNIEMKLTPVKMDGVKILLAEGVVDAALPERMEKILDEHDDISEIWLRSPGGNARAGNAAGRMIRENDNLIITRIPNGWTCFSACNFVFMGGRARILEEGGDFMVHMFTMTGDRDAINYATAMGTESTVGLISEIEQESALMASEDNDFLIRMGVSRKLLTDIMYKQQAVATGEGDGSTRRCLTRKEALEYNVANVD